MLFILNMLNIYFNIKNALLKDLTPLFPGNDAAIAPAEDGLCIDRPERATAGFI
jgi:hypothetical protein